MSEKKVYSRNTVIVLGILCVLSMAGLAGAIIHYASIIDIKDYTISTKDSQLQTLTNQKNQLQTWLNGNGTLLKQMWIWLSDNISVYSYQISLQNLSIYSLKAQITDLQRQIDTFKAPELIKVNLRADDNRTSLEKPYLHVYGYVCNVGGSTAYNSKLHVIAYQSGGIKAIDTYITLGDIASKWWVSVDTNVYYNGSALLYNNWTVTPQWTATP